MRLLPQAEADAYNSRSAAETGGFVDRKAGKGRPSAIERIASPNAHSGFSRLAPCLSAVYYAKQKTTGIWRANMVARKLHTVERRMIPSSDRDIRVLILRPTENARPRENTPGILWLHGGGHLHGMHQKILLPHARLLVEKYGAVVVAPEYRTAFEKPFPADLEDCYAALLFLKVHADELGINDGTDYGGRGKRRGRPHRGHLPFGARPRRGQRRLPDAPLPHAGRPGDRLSRTITRRCGTRAPTGSPGSTISAT